MPADAPTAMAGQKPTVIAVIIVGKKAIVIDAHGKGIEPSGVKDITAVSAIIKPVIASIFTLTLESAIIIPL